MATACSSPRDPATQECVADGKRRELPDLREPDARHFAVAVGELIGLESGFSAHADLREDDHDIVVGEETVGVILKFCSATFPNNSLTASLPRYVPLTVLLPGMGWSWMS